jgi:hypothetical protein
MTVALVTTRHAMWGGDVFKLDSDNSGGLFRKVVLMVSMKPARQRLKFFQALVNRLPQQHC